MLMRRTIENARTNVLLCFQTLNFVRAGLNFYSDVTHQHVAMRVFSIALTLAFNDSYYHIRIEVCEITLVYYLGVLDF